MGELRVGTSGWSYPSGKGTWNGVFYPHRRGRRRGFDELAFYAERFDTVEINTSFYAPPRPEVSRDWVRRTPPRFEFSLKLYQKFTHPSMFKAARLKDVPGTPEQLDALATVNQADIDIFREAIDPLASSGKLGVLLAQFPPSFKDSAESRDHLEWLLKTFRDYQIAVELRHRSWSDRLGDTLELLNAFNAAWVQIDEPKFHFSIRQNQLPNIRGVHYLRLHGRNAAEWWRHRASEDRYNYLYSREELKPIVENAVAASQIVRKAYLYMNNHFAAKSVANAAMVKDMIGDPIGAGLPPEMIGAYPELAGIAAKTRGVRRPV
ncbi:MAG TPA: DUF72 domain-containing protein [Vicinamibacterales bacterium]|nr:DUF72 domain-containing protein [Vicinamibacterales bacterium]